MSDVTDAGYDEWIAAASTGEAYFLECPEGHGSLPPRRLCPTCASSDLEQRPLPAEGEIETVTINYVPTPAFADDAPYATAIASFGPVRITGQVVGIDLEEIDTGLSVGLEVITSKTNADEVVAFRPV